MSNLISGISNLHLPINAMGLAESSPSQDKLSFQNLLLDVLGQTSAMEQSTQAAIEEVVAGGNMTQVEALSALKKADIALRMMLQVRNKLLEAFNEVKQMQM